MLWAWMALERISGKTVRPSGFGTVLLQGCTIWYSPVTGVYHQPACCYTRSPFPAFSSSASCSAKAMASARAPAMAPRHAMPDCSSQYKPSSSTSSADTIACAAIGDEHPPSRRVTNARSASAATRASSSAKPSNSAGSASVRPWIAKIPCPAAGITSCTSSSMPMRSPKPSRRRRRCTCGCRGRARVRYAPGWRMFVADSGTCYRVG